MRKRISVLFLVMAMLCMTACSQSDFEIKPGTPDGKYATQNRNTAVEYSVYLNKQVTVFSGLLNTRMISIQNSANVSNPNELNSAKNALKTMQEIHDEIEITYPSVEGEDDRAAVLTQMELSIKNMEDYISVLEDGGDVSGYADIFAEDFNQITALAPIYYQ